MKTTNTGLFRLWRQSLGLNQREAGEKLGLRQPMVSYLDNGHYVPREDTLLLMDAVARKIELKP